MGSARPLNLATRDDYAYARALDVSRPCAERLSVVHRPGVAVAGATAQGSFNGPPKLRYSEARLD